MFKSSIPEEQALKEPAVDPDEEAAPERSWRRPAIASIYANYDQKVASVHRNSRQECRLLPTTLHAQGKSGGTASS